MAPPPPPLSGWIWLPRIPLPFLNRWRRAIATEELRANRDGIFVNGRHLVRRRAIHSVVLSQDPDGLWFVHVWLRGLDGCVTIGVDDEEDGRALTRALELDARQATAVFRLTDHGDFWRMAGVYAFAFALLGLSAFLKHEKHVVAGMLVVIAAIVALPASLLFMVTLTVGADGLTVRKGLGRRRFIPHDRILAAEVEGCDLVVTLRDGELRWPMTLRKNATGSDLEEGVGRGEAMAKRINEARKAYDELGGDPTSIPALARAGKSTRDWMDALRRIGKEVDAGFRGGVLGRERLWMLVESTQTEARYRIAAAVALRVSGEDVSTRLREIAEACVTPKLGERLRIAADAEEEEALARLLDESEEAVSAFRSSGS